MDGVVVSLGSQDITLGLALGLLVLFVGLAAVLVGIARRRGGQTATEARIAQMTRAQLELSGRMQSAVEAVGSRQAELNRAVSERLDGLGHRIGQSMTETSRNTHESLTQLHERLAVIDRAQANITSLSSQMVELQNVLSNKQARGAFGQGRMETIIKDGLPHGGYSFQATLSNAKRPDCLVYFPNGTPALVIDAKFPLEGWSALKTDDAAVQKSAEAQFRRDLQTHINAIRQRYFIAGETQDTAFMFVPSESVFAEIHESFEAVVQKAHRQRIVIVSPSLLMLSVQVIQAVLKDARMREQAHLIQGEVIRLMEDLGRLDDRVHKLQTHFGHAARDIDMIVTSSEKLARRGTKIEELEFGEPETGEAPAPAAMQPASAKGLRLRVVEDD